MYILKDKVIENGYPFLRGIVFSKHSFNPHPPPLCRKDPVVLSACLRTERIIWS